MYTYLDVVIGLIKIQCIHSVLACTVSNCIILELCRAHTPRARCICIQHIQCRDEISTATMPVADDPYLRIVVGCAHEQKAHGG
jgi:hypothetical protein